MRECEISRKGYVTRFSETSFVRKLAPLAKKLVRSTCSRSGMWRKILFSGSQASLLFHRDLGAFERLLVKVIEGLRYRNSFNERSI